MAITMTARLDPPTALAYLRSLTTDVRAVAVLGPEGDVLAGDPGLAGRAGEAGLLAVGEGRSIVVEPGRHAMEGLLLADMRAALEALDQG